MNYIFSYNYKSKDKKRRSLLQTCVYDLINFTIFRKIIKKCMIELKKISPDDSLEVTRMKDEFNRYAMQMKIQWSELSFDDRKELYEKLRKVEDQLSQYE